MCWTRSPRSRPRSDPANMRAVAVRRAASEPFLVSDTSTFIDQFGRRAMSEPANHVKDTVREKYGRAALQVLEGKRGSCCGDPVSSNLYPAEQALDLPEAALRASLGCGNPTALALLHPGETVLDLGPGGGIDVLLSARRVGPAGKVYGLDRTDEMLALARANEQRAGATNVEWLKGTIEAIPLPAASVDVVISNCVINLSADKAA